MGGEETKDGEARATAIKPKGCKLRGSEADDGYSVMMPRDTTVREAVQV